MLGLGSVRHARLLAALAAGATWGCTAPLRPPEDTTYYTKVRVAGTGACALGEDGYLRCWGDPADGAPTDVEIVDFDFGDQHGCAVTEEGGGRCWAWHGERDGRIGPALAVPDGVWRVVATTALTTCWLSEAGNISCAGVGDFAEEVPPEGTFDAIAGGSSHYCASAPAGDALNCWGWDGAVASAAQLPAANLTAFDAGDTVTCTLTNGGVVVCAGMHYWDGGPAEMAPKGRFGAISAGQTICMLDGAGSVHCEYLDWITDPSRCVIPDTRYHIVGSSFSAVCAGADVGGLWCWADDPTGRGCSVDEPAKLAWGS